MSKAENTPPAYVSTPNEGFMDKVSTLVDPFTSSLLTGGSRADADVVGSRGIAAAAAPLGFCDGGTTT